MTKRILLILMILLLGLIIFVGVVYWLAVKSVEKDVLPASTQAEPGTFFKNSGELIENEITTSTGSTYTETITYVQTGTSETTTETLLPILTSIVYSNANDNSDNIVFSIQSVGKTSEGTIVVSFKVLTYETNNVTSIDPGELVKLIEPSGQTIVARVLQGSFVNMQPNHESTGNAIFFTSTNQDKVFLQIGRGERIKFYEFDFLTRSYRQRDIN